jgi:hypothetical protein
MVDSSSSRSRQYKRLAEIPDGDWENKSNIILSVSVKESYCAREHVEDADPWALKPCTESKSESKSEAAKTVADESVLTLDTL